MLRFHRAAFRFIAACGLFALAAGCAATSRQGDAEVMLRDGQLCFAADAAEQASARGVKLQAAFVSGPKGVKRKDNRSPVVWSFWISKGQPDMELSAYACLPYGVVPPNGEQTVAPQSLQANSVYTVLLNARPTGDYSVLGYKADFCVTLDAAGKPETVRVVPWDKKAGKWRYDVCDAPATR